MTGRRLYELVTSELVSHMPGGKKRSKTWYDTKHHTPAIQVMAPLFDEEGKLIQVPAAPPAFDFLPEYERDAWSAAAARASGRR